MRLSLFLLTPLLLAAAPPDWGTAHELEVRLSSFAFTPERIELKSGDAYRLHLVNTAGGGHNFDAPEFFAKAQVAATDRPRIAKGTIELKGGETADIRFVAPAPGTYKLHCSHLLHASFGMTGEIVVH
ncbi:multicopper oxidase domain-containing protein [Sphingomonas sp. ID1715]|uniref:cupredoxin domain-containing protein n=1 Tax=Sphingomonas sp. ID1715 TaxID=1656898 RepID=UPI0014879045|nr:cupredoxin domain-containing protein [Sphingomonas sp. ID1715]NNM77875.1 multicopper oxidase domain-containing protein [Sphingomonas sp. ID1715]